jgi:glutamine cyclotransferase
MLIVGLPTVLFWCFFLYHQVQGHDLNMIFSTVPQDIPHDSACFTQGLVFKDNILYESCGLFGQSSLRKVDISSGNVLKVANVDDDQIFAEGLTEVNDILYMLTWKNKQVFMYDRHSLELIGIRSIETYNGQGWGLMVVIDYCSTRYPI